MTTLFWTIGEGNRSFRIGLGDMTASHTVNGIGDINGDGFDDLLGQLIVYRR